MTGKSPRKSIMRQPKKRLHWTGLKRVTRRKLTVRLTLTRMTAQPVHWWNRKVSSLNIILIRIRKRSLMGKHMTNFTVRVRRNCFPEDTKSIRRLIWKNKRNCSLPLMIPWKDLKTNPKTELTRCRRQQYQLITTADMLWQSWAAVSRIRIIIR